MKIMDRQQATDFIVSLAKECVDSDSAEHEKYCTARIAEEVDKFTLQSLYNGDFEPFNKACEGLVGTIAVELMGGATRRIKGWH